MESVNTKKIILTLFSVLLIVVFAQIEIVLPLNKEGISITGQTFAILLCAFFLGRWYALIAVAVYITLGAIGLPVFSGGGSGMEKLYGGTAGYFLGFLISAYLVGFFGEKNWSKSFLKSLLAMTIGTLVILILGTLRLAKIYDISEALQIGFYPFLLGGLIKVVLGAICAYFIEKNFKLSSL